MNIYWMLTIFQGLLQALCTPNHVIITAYLLSTFYRYTNSPLFAQCRGTTALQGLRQNLVLLHLFPFALSLLCPFLLTLLHPRHKINTTPGLNGSRYNRFPISTFLRRCFACFDRQRTLVRAEQWEFLVDTERSTVDRFSLGIPENITLWQGSDSKWEWHSSGVCCLGMLPPCGVEGVTAKPGWCPVGQVDKEHNFRSLQGRFHQEPSGW